MELILSGLTQVFNSPLSFILLFGGVFIGVVFGAVPGLTATLAIALFLPLTFRLDLFPSFVLLLSLYIGGISGGLIAAILIKIPGTPASIATTFDGGPMANRGEAWRALSVCIFYSFLGTMFGIFILIFLTPILGRFALKLGMFEYFSISIFSLTLVSALCGQSLIKGLISCFFGLFLACVGAAPIDGFPRYTFGFYGLSAGFDQVPACVGLFALAEILGVKREKKENLKIAEVKRTGFGLTLKEFITQFPNYIRSSSIGTFIGILPGLGGSICNVMAYGITKKTSKYPEKFGTGIIDGLIASESSNNACIGGTMVPLLTLGIPGDTVTAVLLGAFIMNGLSPGPMFYNENINFIYVIFAILIVASLTTFVMQYFGIKGFAMLMKVPKNILLPMVMVLCIIGAFCLNNRIFDIWTFFGWGVLGFIFTRLDIPLTPVIMGFILGPICEVYLRRGLMLSKGSFVAFFTNRISGAFLVLAIIVILATFISEMKKLIRKTKTE